jgi:hypothetical protein
MCDIDKTYLLKELTRTIDESDSTAAFCLCQRWILKDALAVLKEQESVLEALKSDLDETLSVLGEQPEIVRCKDCKNVVAYDDNEVICTHIDSNGNDKHSIDWFCADGERKNDGKS